ncbi:DNA-directed RNA polymerase subunit alpha [Tunisvirus fontaine2]|uniref:DNA-directed RNA polymerase subunit n=1 Tax=Tunisvirus fontaine2 TaxID=1421067 RepID=V9SGU1_9VIRU|nr:DNA-directed RNA polymerase subunit alpha [Tunisvirus fontaine2]AHC55114.1 DNA-directed RNA polymerase subunit alpha [Tunisvirus fontaine2]
MKVRAVQFGVSSPAEILSNSVCEIVSCETRLAKSEKKDADVSYEGTVYDERMGTLDKKRVCKTCRQKTIHCPGHFGHISLKKPVIHSHHVKILGNILKCICLKCSRVLITEDASETLGIMAHKGNARLRQLVKYCDGIEACPNCGKQIPIFSFEGNHLEVCYPGEGTKRAKADKSETTRVPAESLLTILKNISNEDCCLLGLNNFLIDNELYKNKELFPTDMGHRHATRPEWFILTVLPVLPPVCRPPVIVKGKQREDDITDGYVSIVKANIALTKHLNGTTKKKGKDVKKTSKPKKDPYDELCEKIRILFDNKENKKTVNGQVPHGFAQLLKGKEGRFRSNILGSRTNHTARTVITPDPTLPIDVLGVPREMGRVLKAPEIVCRTNWEKCKQMVKDGICKSFIRNGRIFDVAFIKSKTGKCDIAPKDILIVDLPEGYPVLFNRQPTLRIEGFMGLRIQYHNDKTFKFNPSLCSPYGGDSPLTS